MTGPTTEFSSANNPLHSDPVQRAFYEESLLLFRALPVAVAGTLLAIALVCYVLWSVVEQLALLIWAILFCLLTVYRAVQSHSFLHSRDQYEKLRIWVRKYQVATISAAIMWAMIPVFLFPEQDHHRQIILAYVIATTSAVASINIATQKKLVNLYLLIIMLPMIVRFYLQPGEIMGIWTFMMFFSCLLFISGAMRVNRNIVDNIHYRVDIEESQKKLDQSAQRLALHMKNTPLGVVEWDSGLNIIEWNEAAEKIFGYSRGEAIGKNVMQLIVPQQEQQHVHQVVEELKNRTGGAFSLNENITRDGRTILCEWFNTCLLDDDRKVIGVASLVHDVTERIKLDRMKSEFISTVSHELRTPLTSLRGALSILVNDEQRSAQQFHELVGIANRNALRLNSLIDDVLLIQKMENDEAALQLEPQDISELVQQAMEENSGFAIQKNIRFRLENRAERTIVNINRIRILQVFANLLSNAIKFSPENSTVSIVLTSNEKILTVEVCDQGVGVDEGFVPSLFSKFTQYDSSATRQFSGTGLGLSIAKKIIDDHQGEIAYRPADDGGSCFYFNLPLAD